MALRVLGIGDNVADFYIHINTIYPGGCALNFAACTRILGADSAYLGIVGDDFAGRHIMFTAKQMGIGTARCRVMHGQTPLPAVKIEDGERTFVGMNEHGVWERELILREEDLKYICGFDLLHTSLYSAMEQNLEILAETRVPVSMDFGTTYSDMLFEALCPYLTFAEMSCGHIPMEQMLEQIRKAHDFGAKYVIATRGKEGSWFSDKDQVYHRPAHLVDAVDTMCAGDSFISAFLLSYVGWLKWTNGMDAGSAAVQALDAASAFSAKICLVNGSWGHGTEYHEDVIID